MRISDLAALGGAVPGEAVESMSVLATGEPLLVEPGGTVDPDSVASAAAVLRRLPTVTVLLGDPGLPSLLADAVDVCVTTAADPPAPWVRDDLDAVTEMVRCQPLATLSLVVLLRNTGPLGSWSAAAEESATYSMLLGSASFAGWLERRGPSRHKRTASPLEIERVDDVLHLTLDRPEARNAIDSALRDALVDALRLAAADPTLRVELRGNGPCFSAGGDLEEFGTVGDPATAHAVRLTRHPGIALDAVAARATCYLRGPCVGAGVEIPAFAGRVLADPGTTFRLPEVSMGLVPGAGGTMSLPRRIGRQRAGWLALTGATLDAQTAVAWGLVDELSVGS